VSHDGWPQSLTCSEVKHGPASLAPGWVTTRVFNDEYSPHIHMFQTNRTLRTVKTRWLGLNNGGAENLKNNNNNKNKNVFECLNIVSHRNLNCI